MSDRVSATNRWRYLDYVEQPVGGGPPHWEWQCMHCQTVRRTESGVRPEPHGCERVLDEVVLPPNLSELTRDQLLEFVDDLGLGTELALWAAGRTHAAPTPDEVDDDEVDDDSNDDENEHGFEYIEGCLCSSCREYRESHGEDNDDDDLADLEEDD